MARDPSRSIRRSVAPPIQLSMASHLNKQDLAAGVTDCKENMEGLEPDRLHAEEITGPDIPSRRLRGLYLQSDGIVGTRETASCRALAPAAVSSPLDYRKRTPDRSQTAPSCVLTLRIAHSALSERFPALPESFRPARRQTAACSDSAHLYLAAYRGHLHSVAPPRIRAKRRQTSRQR